MATADAQDKGLMEGIVDFLAHPYTGKDMSATRWFVFTGFLLVCLFLWGRVLHIMQKVTAD